MLVINIVITAHAEGHTLKAALRSALANREWAEQIQGTRVSLFVYLDSATKATVETAREFSSDFVLVETNHKDLAKVRNQAIRDIPNGFVAFLDGDDLFCDTWIRNCVEKLSLENRTDKDMFVFHPEINFYFGHKSARGSLVFKQVGSRDSSFDVWSLAFQNHWSALAFAPKIVYESVPYVSNSPENGIGFEDWTFNIQCLELGIEHYIVPETTHFLREKPKKMSLRQRSSHKRLSPYPSKLWRINLDLKPAQAGKGLL